MCIVVINTKYCNILTNGRRDSKKVNVQCFRIQMILYCKTLILIFYYHGDICYYGLLRRKRG